VFSVRRFFSAAFSFSFSETLEALEPFDPFATFSFSGLSSTGVDGRDSVAETFPLLVVESPAIDPTLFPPLGVELLAPPEDFLFAPFLYHQSNYLADLNLNQYH